MINTSKRKLLIISPAPEILGGVNNFIATLKKNLQNYTLTSFWVGRIGKENLFASIYRVVSSSISFANLLLKNKFDIVHINPSLNSKSLLRDGLLLLILRIMGVRQVLVYFHGWQNSVAEKLEQPILKQFFVFLLNGTACIMVLSANFKTQLVRLGVKSDKIIVTRTMFDDELFSDSLSWDERSEATSDQVGAQPVRRMSANNKILFLSRFEKSKGVYELIAAFEQISSEFPELELIMAGDGIENEQLRMLAKSNNKIKFVGYIEGKEKTELLLSCKIFVLPTYFPEGMPVAILEAMRAGKPILTSKAGGIAENITAENAIMLDKITTDTVVNGLRKLLKNLNLCEKMAENNLAYSKHFSAKIVSKEIEAAYDKISG